MKIYEIEWPIQTTYLIENNTLLGSDLMILEWNFLKDILNF